jgi:hypothetical protein
MGQCERLSWCSVFIQIADQYDPAVLPSGRSSRAAPLTIRGLASCGSDSAVVQMEAQKGPGNAGSQGESAGAEPCSNLILASFHGPSPCPHGLSGAFPHIHPELDGPSREGPESIIHCCRSHNWRNRAEGARDCQPLVLP